MSLFEGRIKLVDEHGLSTTKIVQLDVDDVAYVTRIARITAADTALENFAAALDDITDAVIESVSLTVPSGVTGLKTTPGDQGVAEGAVLQMATLDNNSNPQTRPYWLPSAIAGVFNANFRTINVGAAALVTWENTFDANNVLITVSDGETVTGIESGHYATRRRSIS